MLKIFDIFDKNGELGSNRQFTLSGDKDWNQFKIYIFIKKQTGRVKELEILNSLLAKHRLEDYGQFHVCIGHLLLPDRSFAFMSKNKNIKKQNEH